MIYTWNFYYFYKMSSQIFNIMLYNKADDGFIEI